MSRGHHRHQNPILRLGLAAAAALTVALLTVVAVLAAATAQATASEPVLGSPGYLAPGGEGWGTAHPSSIYNGGDPAGNASKLVWKHWGAASAKGRGLIPIFRPGGGYYGRPGRIVLKADQLGTCADGTYAYTRLTFRVAHRPSGPVGKHWHPWASPSGGICTSP